MKKEVMFASLGDLRVLEPHQSLCKNCCCCWQVFLLDASNAAGAADPAVMFVTWHSKHLWVCKIHASVPQHKWLAFLP